MKYKLGFLYQEYLGSTLVNVKVIDYDASKGYQVKKTDVDGNVRLDWVFGDELDALLDGYKEMRNDIS